MSRSQEDFHAAALVISECQNGLINPEYATTHTGLAAQAAEREIVPRIAALAAAFRAAGRPVAYATIVPAADWSGYSLAAPLARHMRRKDELKDGTPQALIHPGLTPVEGDLIVERRDGMTSFHGTALEELLRERGIETVVVVGISTNIAIPGTTLEAVNRDFRVVVPQDCTAATSAEVQEFQMTNLIPALATVMDSAEVISALEQLAVPSRG